MEHRAARFDPDPVSGQLRPPAEVDLLHVGDKIAVEAAESSEYFAAHQHTRSRRPKHFARGVVLPPVGLDRVEDSPAAERITQKIDEAAGGPGVFEFAGIGVGTDLGSDGRRRRVPFEQFHQRSEPSFGHLDVRIEQDAVVGFDPGQGPVVSFGKAVIPIQQQQFDLRKPRPDEIRRIVRRSVVGDDDVCAGGTGDQHRQEPFEVRTAVPV